MAESFLKEQLKRIRAMIERMSEVHDRAAEVTEDMARDRAALHPGPLHEVRDFRTYSPSPDGGSESSNAATPHAALHADRARDAGRRRRRR